MTAFLLLHEPAIRLAGFLMVLAAMMLWELAAPCRRHEMPRLIRWTNNLALVVIDAALVRLCFPVLAVGVAIWAEGRGWGLLNLTDLPGAWAVIAAILLLDLATYGQHVLFHAVPALWRLHRMHHADLDVDATTGLRFHPAEILLSMAIRLVLVVLIGAPPIAVLVFEVLLNAAAIFNHANITLPPAVERRLRWVLVTPDMHRIHHSANPAETNANYGFAVPWWDRLLGTYVARAALGQTGMTIGLTQFRDRREAWLDRLLLQPLRPLIRRQPPPRSGPGA